MSSLLFLLREKVLMKFVGLKACNSGLEILPTFEVESWPGFAWLRHRQLSDSGTRE